MSPGEMHRLVPEGTHGVAEVEHFTIDQFQLMRAAMRSSPGLGYTDPKKTYTRLLVKNELVMSDTFMEVITNSAFVARATGDVLIAGLGLGMIVHAIAKKSEVRSITVIEQEPDVIALIAPTLPVKKRCPITVLPGDIFTWRPAPGMKFDTIYFDIWASISTDNLMQMTTLHQAFKRYKRSKESYMQSWYRNILKTMKRAEPRRVWGYA